MSFEFFKIRSLYVLETDVKEISRNSSNCLETEGVGLGYNSHNTWKIDYEKLY